MCTAAYRPSAITSLPFLHTLCFSQLEIFLTGQ